MVGNSWNLCSVLSNFSFFFFFLTRHPGADSEHEKFSQPRFWIDFFYMQILGFTFSGVPFLPQFLPSSLSFWLLCQLLTLSSHILSQWGCSHYIVPTLKTRQLITLTPINSRLSPTLCSSLISLQYLCKVERLLLFCPDFMLFYLQNYLSDKITLTLPKIRNPSF